MMPKKRFCLRGHDTSLVGRAKTRICRSCAVENATAWGKANPLRVKTNRRNRQWRDFDIKNADGSQFTSVDYDRAYQVQQGRCKGCGTHQAELKGRLRVDHDHKTGIFRCLLCNGCNCAIGQAGESPALLRKLADMLETMERDPT